VAVLAAFGSGASTLLDLLAGMRTATAGRVLVDAVDTADWNLDALHAQVMLVREGDLMSGTVAENLRLGRDGVAVSQLNAGLEAVGLGDAIRALPDGLQTPLITGGLPLTGRQRIRLLVARALVMRPRLLLIDELLDGLDEATFEQLCRAVLDPALGWTVVVATRDPRVARRLGRTIELVAPAPGPEVAP
jgi:ABC-type bacteriocin/lantibiotic exporter with double-glycine peptidase domain